MDLQPQVNETRTGRKGNHIPQGRALGGPEGKYKDTYVKIK